MDKVKVLFKKVKNPYTNEYEIVAFFPQLSACYGNIMSYSHIGQHGEASIEFCRECKPATSEEYMPLLAELQSIYDDCILEVKKRLYYNDLLSTWHRHYHGW